jgi:hypothetical protein
LRRSLTLIVLITMLFPAITKAQAAKQQKGNIRGTIDSVSESEIVIIDKDNDKIPLAIKDHNKIDITISKLVPPELIYDNAYARVFGEVDRQKNIIISNRMEFYDPNPGWGKKKTDKHGATGFLSNDNGVIRIEVDDTLLTVQWKNETPKITHKKTDASINDLNKGFPVKIEYISDADQVWVKKINADAPEMKKQKKQKSKKNTENKPKEKKQPEAKKAKSSNTTSEAEKFNIKIKPINTGHKTLD